MLLRDWSEAEGRPTWLQVDAMCMDNILTGRDVRAAVTVTVGKFEDAHSERDDSTNGRDSFKSPWIQSQRSGDLT